MAIQTITYADKVALNENQDISDINKCNASDLNEIKNVVNNNASEIPKKVSDLSNDSNFVSLTGVMSEGSNVNGSWIKFETGTMICYKVVEGTANITTAWGNGYTTGSTNTIDLGDFADEFIDVPMVQITPVRGSGSQNYFVGASDGITKSYAGKTSLLRFTSQSNATYKLQVLAIGKWK